jgi:hypothetical protein
MKSGSITTTAVSVGTSAVLLSGASGPRERLIVQNLHASQILYVGGSDVTTSNGIRIAAGEAREFENLVGAVYGIASGATTDVRVGVIG